MEFQDILKEADRPHIKALDFSAFGQSDILNCVLQRSEILSDQRRPGQLIRAWSNGDEGPLLQVVEQLGPELVARTAAVNFLEFEELKPVLDELKPERVADIGCGYGFFDFFLSRDSDTKIVLIDLEESEDRHFGFQDEGSAYTSLAVARQFMIDNGISAERIKTVNPSTSDVGRIRGVDLAVSFLSCGFHYPLSTYEGFFSKVLAGGGAMIVDVRQTQGSEKDAELQEYGDTREISLFSKRRRVLVN